jgi:Rod binding domain-containing protein
MPLESLPPVDSSLLPADVRAAGPEARELYSAALAFERVLLGELTKAVADFGVGEEEGDESAAAGVYRGQLPGALADGISQAGGIGLAEALYRALTPGLEPAAGSVQTIGSVPAAGPAAVVALEPAPASGLALGPEETA